MSVGDRKSSPTSELSEASSRRSPSSSPPLGAYHPGGSPDRAAPSPPGPLTPPGRAEPGPVATSYGCRCDHCFRRDAALKRNLEGEGSELPPKYKYRHLSSTSPTSDTFGPDSGSDQSHNRRCTGTQTSFSSFPHDMYPNQRPTDYKILDLDRLSRPGVDHIPARHLHIPAMVPPSSRAAAAAPYVSRRSPPTTGRARRSPPLRSPSGEDPHGAPLNLTTSVTSQQQQQHNHQQQQHSQQLRPSVITIAPSAYVGQRGVGHGSPPRRSSPQHPSETPTGKITSDTDVRLFILPSEPCGTSIDEHFRRSLGQNYPAMYGSAPASPMTVSPMTGSPQTASPDRSRSPPSPLPAPPVYQLPDMPPAEKPKNNVSIAGTVDDHFAKSLGDKWNEINPAKQPVQLDILAGSVDDHFAKALGDTWLRIKAEKERPEGSNPGSPAANTK